MEVKFWIPITLSIILALWNFYQQIHLQQLKKIADKKLHIHRLQFDKEFQIYSEVWAELVNLRNIVAKLRPSGDMMDDPNLSYDENINRRMNTAIEVGNSVIGKVYNNKPFYSKEIYESLHEIIKLVGNEISDVHLRDRKSREYWEKGENTREKLFRLSEEVCEKIRDRIGILEK